MSLAENNFSAKDADMLRAYYIARSGAEAYAKSAEWANTLPAPPATPIDFGGGNFRITSVDTSSKLVTAVGTYNKSSKTVKLKLRYRGVFGSAVFAINNLNMHNNSSLTGDVSLATGATLTGDVTNIHGGITHNCPNPYTGIPLHTDPATNPGLPIHSGGGMLTGTPNAYESIDLGSSNILVINTTGGSVTEIDTGSFKGENSVVNVKGGGSLVIHTKSLDFKGNVFTDPDTLTIFVIAPGGSANIKTGSSAFQAFLYGPGASVTISADMLMIGGIIADNVSIESGGSLEFPPTVPHALLPYVDPSVLNISPFGYEKDVWED